MKTLRPDPNNPETLVSEDGRAYPSRYAPGAHWATDEAWRLLDMFKPDLLPREERFLLSGMIAGALMKAKSR